MTVVYAVMYGPGEPDGVYTMAVCATRERAEQEIIDLTKPYTYAGYTGSYYDAEHLFIEEMEVLE